MRTQAERLDYLRQRAESGDDPASEALLMFRAAEKMDHMIELGVGRIVWESDPEPDTSWMDVQQFDQYMRDVLVIQCCSIQIRPDVDSEWEARASLCGISLLMDGSDDPYPMIVEAELALEAGILDIPIQLELEEL